MDKHNKDISENTKMKIKQIKLKLKKYDSNPNLSEGDQEAFELPFDLEKIRHNVSLIISTGLQDVSTLNEKNVTSNLTEQIMECIRQEYTVSSEKMRDLSIELKDDMFFEKELRLLNEIRVSELEEEIEELNKFQTQLKRSGSVKGNLEVQIKSLDKENKSLKQELEKMQELYSQLIESKAVLFFEKECLKQELEDLTRDLFEEANRMVSEEAKIRAQLESSNQKLTHELKRALENFASIAQKASSRKGSDQRGMTPSRLTSESLKDLCSSPL